MVYFFVCYRQQAEITETFHSQGFVCQKIIILVCNCKISCVSPHLQIAFAMFGVYVMLDDRNVLDAQKVFVSMAIINILKTPLSQLPFAISTTMQVGDVSLRSAPCSTSMIPNDEHFYCWIINIWSSLSVPGSSFTETSWKISVLRGTEGGQRLKGPTELW